MKNTLLSLLNTPGISGYETIGGISTKIAELASTIPNAQVKADALGNVWLKLGQGKKILVEAHLDEVGFMVSKFLSKKVVQLIPVGGIRAERVSGAQLTIVSRLGTSSATIQNDFHAKVEDPTQVQPGSWCYFDRQIKQVGDLITSPALDNRVSCAVLLELAKTAQLENIELNMLWATQHEQGSSVSILNWINHIQPELVIICDSAYAQPSGDPEWNIPELGKGTAIQLIGTDFIVNGGLVNQLVKVAQINKIEFQFEIPANNAGGTDASKIPNTIPFAVVNTPVRNQHTGVGQANMQDLNATVRLLREFLAKIVGCLTDSAL